MSTLMYDGPDGHHRHDGPDTALVAAARGGDGRALDALIGQSRPLVYNIVGRALDGPADPAGAVQETFRRMVRYLPDLRDPGAFRCWLVTIAVRVVSEEQRNAPRPPRAVDPAGDFVGLTIRSLGLADQRREVAEATRWVDAEDRALLSVWWLVEIGELTREEAARALALPVPQADVQVQRLKGQITQARGVIRALGAEPACRDLGLVAQGWDGRPDPRWRPRLGGHVQDCGWCRATAGGRHPTGALLAGLPLVPVPAGPPVAAGAPGPAVFAGPPGPAVFNRAGPAVPEPATQAIRAVPRGDQPRPEPAPRPRSRPAPRPPSRSQPRPRPRSGVRAFTPAAAPVPFLAVAMLMIAVVTATVLVRTSALPGAGGTTLSAARPGPGPGGVTPGPLTPGRKGARTPAARPTTARPGTSTPSAGAAVAPARPVVSARKGVTAKSFDGGDQALVASGAGWYYTWSTAHAGLTTPAGVRFIPTIWGAGSVTSEALAEARSNGPDLLTFNEPDRPDQANLTPTEALDLWPQLMASGLKLGSPAVSSGATDPDGWLGRFMSGAAARGYRVDFIALHWYGSDFSSASSTERLRSYIQAVYDRYHKPIWLTEYALINFSGGASHYPSDAQQAAFITASTRMLDGLPYLARYAWYTLPASDTRPSSGLYYSGARPTAAGRAFEAAR